VKSPVHPDDLTAEWLTDALASTGALTHGRVTSCNIQQLVSDKGMTGPIARVHLVYDRDTLDAPRSLVAKFSAPDSEFRAIIHGMGFYEREVRFYEQLAGRSRIRTPRCYFSILDPAEGLALLLLEDLATSRNGNWVAGCSAAEAELAVRALAALHAAWWQHPELEEQHWLGLRSLVSVEQAPAFFEQAWEPFLTTYGPHVADEVLQTGMWLKQYLARLYVYLYQQPPCTLIHNDFQADNLFFADTGPIQELIVVDWQLATRGRAAIDVASFVCGHLEPRDRRNHEQRLLRIYHTLLVDSGVRDYTFEQCWDDYRLAMLQPVSRLMSVVGFGVTTEAQTRRFCDVILPRFCQAAHDLQVGDVLHAVLSEAHDNPV
jgi:hypothetical protein